MLIDTHCHLDASEFNEDRTQVIARAQSAGVRAIVIPSVERANFDTVRGLAHSFSGGFYALGIHPIFVPQADESDLLVLDAQIKASLGDPRFVAIGEIGLDFFIPALAEPAMRARQEMYYTAQLDLALHYDLPVLLHVRRSQDVLLKHLRHRSHIGGLAHAFNGSFQQAAQFIDQGFALGLGGAMTFERSLQIRRLATRLPLEALVLETDAPDIPPAWLGTKQTPSRRNEPAQVAGIADVLSELRALPRVQLDDALAANARRVLPRLAAGMTAT